VLVKLRRSDFGIISSKSVSNVILDCGIKPGTSGMPEDAAGCVVLKMKIFKPGTDYPMIIVFSSDIASSYGFAVIGDRFLSSDLRMGRV